MKKSPPYPLIIIISVFIVIPVVFWILTFRKGTDDVRGLATESSGILVKIVSKNGTWEMSKYLCEDKSTCLESLTSGMSSEKTSGGGGVDQSVVIKPSLGWDPYEYLKIFVKSGWGSTERFFSASLTNEVKDGFIEKFNYGGNTYEAVILPIKTLEKDLVDSVTFSD